MRECGRDFSHVFVGGAAVRVSRVCTEDSTTEEKVPNKVGATACAYIKPYGYLARRN